MNNLSLNQFFRYACGGLFIFAAFFLFFPNEINYLKNALGNIAFSMLVLAIGAVFYGVYKILVSEMIIDRIHFTARHHYNNCCFSIIKRKGVLRRDLLCAFRLIRDKLFEKEVANVYEMRHSEVHLLYITATILFILLAMLTIFCYCKIGAFSPFQYITLSFAVSFFFGLFYCVAKYTDLKLCYDERSYFLTLNKDKIDKILESAGLIKTSDFKKFTSKLFRISRILKMQICRSLCKIKISSFNRKKIKVVHI